MLAIATKFLPRGRGSYLRYVLAARMAVVNIRVWTRAQRTQVAFGALTVAAACWAASLVMTKSLLPSFPPLTLLFVQLTASMCVLWTAVAAFGAPVRTDRTLALAGLTGIVEPGLVYVVEIFGLALTSASHAALIGALEPVLIVLLALVCLRERLDMRTMAVALTACAGLVLVVEPTAADSRFIGDLLIFVATLIAAFYVVFARLILLRMSALNLVTAQQTAAWLFSLVLLLIAVGTGFYPLGLEDVTAGLLAAAALTGIVQFAVPFWLYLWALKHISASNTAPYVALVPVFAIAGGCLALGESMTSIQWIGAIVIVYAVSRFKPNESGRRDRRLADPTD